MVRSVLARGGLLLSLVLMLSALSPTLTTAQVSPLEGAEWHLVTYTQGDRVKAVPWQVQATMQLAGGQLIAHGGCNGISGSYELDGSGLSFDRLAHTYVGCPSTAASSVEGAFVNALPEVASWATDSGRASGEGWLHLYDTDGETLLAFQRPVLALTLHDIEALAAQLARQQAAIERLEERVDNVRIGTLRERIRTLEDTVKRLRTSSTTTSPAFNAAEKVLLGAVRKDIAERCEPRRSQNPTGTIAALQCQPDAPEVEDMAYFLMESEDASKVWSKRMEDFGVKDGTQNRSCGLGKPSHMYWTGGGLEVAGCYRNEDGRANLRFVNVLAQCRQLTAGQTQVKNPAIYIAVLGPDRDITSLYGWAASSPEWEAGDNLFHPIKQPGQPWSDQCPHA